MRNKKIIKTSIIGILVNISLVILKFVIGFLSNSIAIVLDAVNNLTDSISSIINIIGTKLSNKAPDKKHPYGHGRIEYFTSFAISAIVLIVGVSALKESILKIINPVEPNYSFIFLFLIAIGVVVKIVYGRYVKKMGKKLNSHALLATSADSIMDAFLSFTTLLGAISSYFFKINVEGYLGVLISLIIIKTAIGLLGETVSLLMGERPDKELTSKLKEKILTFDKVKSVDDLYLHYYGPSKIISSAHIQVSNNLTAEEIYILTREIEYQIYQDYGINITLGIYAGNDSDRYVHIKEDVEEMIKEYPSIIQMHGFYVDHDNNIYFDLIFDFEESHRDRIKNKIVKELKEKYKEYNFIVILDSDISD